MRILIIDDEELVRRRLQRVATRVYPELECTMAGTLVHARALMGRQHFDLVLLDVGLPDGNGITLLPWMQTHAPQIEAVVVSSLGDDATVLRAIRAGAVGYLLKNGDDMELELSLRSMQRGGAPIDPVIARRILALMNAPPAVTMVPRAAGVNAGELTEREMDVLHLVAQGHSNREIAESLQLSIHTVECHAKNIYRKLAVRSRGAAVHSARSMGLLP